MPCSPQEQRGPLPSHPSLQYVSSLRVFLERGVITVIAAALWVLVLFSSQSFYLHSLLFLTATLCHGIALSPC